MMRVCEWRDQGFLWSFKVVAEPLYRAGDLDDLARCRTSSNRSLRTTCLVVQGLRSAMADPVPVPLGASGVLPSSLVLKEGFSDGLALCRILMVARRPGGVNSR